METVLIVLIIVGGILRFTSYLFDYLKVSSSMENERLRKEVDAMGNDTIEVKKLTQSVKDLA